MSKQPDLSAFPISRKDGVRSIASEGSKGGMLDGEAETAREETRAYDTASSPARTSPPADASADAPARTPPAGRPPMPDEAPSSGQSSSGQAVATTVKLDENRCMRLAEAGKPGLGRMRRRTIQDTVIEALDEWFERRDL